MSVYLKPNIEYIFQMICKYGTRISLKDLYSAEKERKEVLCAVCENEPNLCPGCVVEKELENENN